MLSSVVSEVKLLTNGMALFVRVRSNRKAAFKWVLSWHLSETHFMETEQLQPVTCLS